MAEELNKKLQEILDFLNSEVQLKGYPPSVREICAAVDLKSTSTVHSYLEKLEKLGYIKKDPTKPRALKIKKEYTTATVTQRSELTSPKVSKEMFEIPIVGKVTAGEPILAEENIEDYFPLPGDFVREEGTFMLKVQGESMIEAGIFDGDYVVVHPQKDAFNGTIVVAMIDNEATIKTFYKERNHFRLQPENPTMLPIIVREVEIIGKVIAVIRRIR